MKRSGEYLKLIKMGKEINSRIDDIERLLKLLLANNLIDDAENAIQECVSDALGNASQETPEK